MEVGPSNGVVFVGVGAYKELVAKFVSHDSNSMPFPFLLTKPIKRKNVSHQY